MLKRAMGLCAVLFLAVATASMGAEGETVTVMGRGTGTSRAMALEDAYRDAIERAVGLYADAEQLMANHELVKDQILTHSNAYIERYEVKKETDLGRGLTEIRILATVKMLALTQKIKDVMPARTFQLKGAGNLHAKSTTTQKREKSAAALVRNALDGVNPVTQMMTVSLAGATPKAGEAKPGGARKRTMYYLPVRVAVDEGKYFGRFLPSLLAVFDQIALEPPKVLYLNKTTTHRRWAVKIPSRAASEYGAQPPDQGSFAFIDTVGLGNGDYQWNTGSGFDWWEYTYTEYPSWKVGCTKENLQKQGCVHVLAITEMNADGSVVKAKHYRLPTDCASVLTKWYNDLAANGRFTRYRAVVMDGDGREIAAASFAFDNWALLNCAVGQSSEGFGAPDRKKGLIELYGLYLTPLAGGRARACERCVWFDIPAKELPNVQSVKIELAE